MIDIPAVNLTTALNQALLSQPETWSDTMLHVSDLSVWLPIENGGMCHRQLWLRLNGANKREPTIGQLMMWDHGHRIEERVNGLAKKYMQNGWQFLDIPKEDRRVELPGGITGEFDAKLIHQSGLTLILDNKTVRGNAFRYGIKDNAKESNIIQVCGYVMAEGANGGILWYIDREGQNTPIEHFVPRNDYVIEQAIDVALYISKLNEPPPELEPIFSIRENKTMTSLLAKQPWQCDWCDYQDLSCDGALPYDLRSSSPRVIGHIKDSINIKEDYLKYEKLVDVIKGIELSTLINI